MVIGHVEMTNRSECFILPLTMPGLGETNLSDLDQPDLRIRILRAPPDPSAKKDNPVRNKVRAAFIELNHPLAFRFELVIEAFIRIQMEHPTVLELDFIERVISLRTEIIEWPLKDSGTRVFRDLPGCVAT